jgi:hypothetical protein
MRFAMTAGTVRRRGGCASAAILLAAILLVSPPLAGPAAAAPVPVLASPRPEVRVSATTAVEATSTTSTIRPRAGHDAATSGWLPLVLAAIFFLALLTPAYGSHSHAHWHRH